MNLITTSIYMFTVSSKVIQIVFKGTKVRIRLFMKIFLTSAEDSQIQIGFYKNCTFQLNILFHFSSLVSTSCHLS
jgi:hypothetical protein